MAVVGVAGKYPNNFKTGKLMREEKMVQKVEATWEISKDGVENSDFIENQLVKSNTGRCSKKISHDVFFNNSRAARTATTRQGRRGARRTSSTGRCSGQ